MLGGSEVSQDVPGPLISTGVRGFLYCASEATPPCHGSAGQVIPAQLQLPQCSAIAIVIMQFAGLSYAGV